MPDACSGQRLDQVAASLFTDYSRARLQQWIKEGRLLVDGASARPRDKLFGGEELSLEAELEAQGEWQPQEIGLDLVFEDAHIMVLNKPAGLVVHPAAGNPDGTLLNGLLHHAPEVAAVPRAGIVHRLDKDTSGLMVVARTLAAQVSLVAQLKARTVSRVYEAVVNGCLTGGGTIDNFMGRHRQNRLKMAVLPEIEGRTDRKPAITHYRLIRNYRAHSHVQCKLETGRTHQIRVHMAHIGHPLVGDPLYGGRPKLPKGASPETIACLQGFERQALHAARLGLVHPESGEEMEWQVPLPADFRVLLDTLDDDLRQYPENDLDR
ncbi:23S rRNA pseudouridine(1911/1915/1917) synthase RluD [Biformimicrobium ophioploci]|uniref:Pseudouridine synthase n=1 Tax=Biformimicrobium ophioploci TaxID=3036711 RepID=A0ABQ6M2K1_9GAMM|nr:23S rRNA pseudouridine(1911/1915/1917) synthase RluD [Microbulbifer sp. NKW57]